MMKLSVAVKTILAAAGGLGIIYELYVYFNAIEFVDNTRGRPVPIIVLILVFVIWFAAILTLNQIGDLKTMDLRTKLNPIKFWRAIFKGTSVWVIILAVAAAVFGMVNVGLMIDDFGVTDIIGGKYVIHNHGQILKELSEQEYLVAKSKELKGMTATHIFFLGMGSGILFPRKKGFDQEA